MYQDRIAAGCTGSDLLSIWINAEINGEKLDESQLLFEHVLLNVGGAETTRSAIAGGLERLSNDQKQYDALVEDPSLIPNAVEEIIRWVCPFVNMYRTATRDYEIHGKVIKEGQQVGLTYPAANRDPRHFKDPHTFNIFRDFSKESKHLSFGLGPHFCLGASLARMEIRLSLEEMTQRVKRITSPEGKPPVYVSSSFRAWSRSYPCDSRTSVRRLTVASAAAEEKSPYELLGGDEGVRKLTADFYGLMDTLPEAAPIRAMHKGDLSEMSDKLGTFLIGWLGGPQRYQERFGRVIIPLAHKPFSDRAERTRPVAAVHEGRARKDLARRLDESAADGFLWAHGRDVPHARLTNDIKKG